MHVVLIFVQIPACAVMAPAARGARQDIKPERQKKAPLQEKGKRQRRMRRLREEKRG
jgi:hypothetical protein